MTLVPDFRLVKTIGRGSHTFLTKIQNRKSRWPCNPDCARIRSDHQTLSAVMLAWWWELHDTCFATLDFVFPAPAVLKTSGCSVYHSSPAFRSFGYCSGKTTGRMAEDARFDSRHRQELFIRSWKLWDWLWVPVVTGGSVLEVKAARTWSWPHLRLSRV
jgi:hypothetical protein